MGRRRKKWLLTFRLYIFALFELLSVVDYFNFIKNKAYPLDIENRVYINMWEDSAYYFSSSCGCVFRNYRLGNQFPYHSCMFILKFLISLGFVRLAASVVCFGAAGIGGHSLSFCWVLSFEASQHPLRWVSLSPQSHSWVGFWFWISLRFWRNSSSSHVALLLTLKVAFLSKHASRVLLVFQFTELWFLRNEWLVTPVELFPWNFPLDCNTKPAPNRHIPCM